MCFSAWVDCATGLPEQAVSVRAAAALTASQSLNGSTSFPQHTHTQQFTEFGKEDREWTGEREEDTEEAEEFSDIMSARQMSIKER